MYELFRREAAARRQAVQQNKCSLSPQFVRSVLLTETGIFAACAVVVWLGGGRTWYDYGNALVLFGTAVVCVGAASVFAGWALARNAVYNCDQPASSDLVRRLIRQALESRRRYYSFMIRTAVIGAIPTLVGMLIQAYLS